MSDLKTIVGVCEGVEKQNGFSKFSLRKEGDQYPTVVSTKKESLVAQAMQAWQDQTVSSWTFSEHDSKNINENTGKPFKNRYLESVGTPDSVAAQQAPASPVLPPAPAAPQTERHEVTIRADQIPYAATARDELIVRQVAVKSLGPAFSALVGMKVEADRENAERFLTRLLVRLEDHMLNGPVRVGATEYEGGSDMSEIPFAPAIW
jgi:hypothetical protein